MGVMQSIPSRHLRRAAMVLAGTASVSMVFAAGVASAAPGYPVPSFGTGGAVVSGFGLNSSQTSGGSGVAVASNGDVYQVGYADDASSVSQLYVARYLPNGTLDSTFGTGGVVYPAVDGVQSSAADNGPFGPSASVAFSPSGEPVVLTQATTSTGAYGLAVLELTQSGTLDKSFNASGAEPGVEAIQINHDDTYVGGLAVQSDGQIVLTGQFKGAGGDEFFAERLNGDGSVDTSFGPSSNGIEALQLGQDNAYSGGTGVIAQSDGDLAFSAVAHDASGDYQFAVLRLTSSGQPDDSFGAAGVAYAQPSTATTPASEPISITATSDGGYALAGEAAATPSSELLAVARFSASGQLDSSFGSDGTFLLPANSSDGMIVSIGTAIFAQPDGKLIVSGVGGNLFGSPSASFNGIAPLVLRLNADGGIDSAFGYGGQLAAAPSSEEINGPEAAAESSDGNLFLSGVAGDLIGGSSESILEEFSLDSAPSVVIASSANSVQAGTPVQFAAAAVGSDDESVSGLSWDLGSGSFGDATGTTATKTFATPGTYTVRVEATDGFGMSSTATQTITVTPAPTPAAVTPATTVTPAATSTSVTPAAVIAPTLKLVKLTVSHGKVKVTLLCAFAACKVNANLTTHVRSAKGKSASLSANGRGKAVTVASTKLSLGVNQKHTFTLKLNKRGASLLKRFGKIPAVASFKLTNTKPAKTIHHNVRVH